MTETLFSKGAARALALAFGFLAGCGAASTETGQDAAPGRVERYGDLEIITHTRHASNANNGGALAGEHWSLRWRGQPVAVDSLGGMALDQPSRADSFNAVFTVGDPKKPDILVNAGDPNNAAVFQLLRQENGRLAAPVLCKTFAGDNAVRVLDGDGAGKVFQGPNDQALFGAHRLLLGNACVYDTATRKVQAIPAKPEDAHLPPFSRAIALSPDGRSLAWVGLADATAPVVLVADLDRGVWSRLPIDPQRMRYGEFEEIDPAWLDHHFQWRRGAGGRDRLVERAGFQPLPWRGTYSPNGAQYDVRAAEVDYSGPLGEFLVRRFHAQRLPGDKSWREGGLTYEVEQEIVNVTGRGFYIAQLGKPYWPGQPGDPKRQKQLIHRIGDAFNTELAAGLHGAMFIPAPEEPLKTRP